LYTRTYDYTIALAELAEKHCAVCVRDLAAGSGRGSATCPRRTAHGHAHTAETVLVCYGVHRAAVSPCGATNGIMPSAAMGDARSLTCLARSKELRHRRLLLQRLVALLR